MKIVADISELKILAADLAKAGSLVRKPVNSELRQAAVQVRRTARVLAPRRTGALARSITFSSSNKGLTYEVGPKVFYGRFQEHGTVKMAAHPFMEPAAAGLEDLPDRVAEAAAKALLSRGL